MVTEQYEGAGVRWMRLGRAGGLLVPGGQLHFMICIKSAKGVVGVVSKSLRTV